MHNIQGETSYEKLINRESRLLTVERALHNNNFKYSIDTIKHILAEIRQERELLIVKGRAY